MSLKLPIDLITNKKHCILNIIINLTKWNSIFYNILCAVLVPQILFKLYVDKSSVYIIHNRLKIIKTPDLNKYYT